MVHFGACSKKRNAAAEIGVTVRLGVVGYLMVKGVVFSTDINAHIDREIEYFPETDRGDLGADMSVAQADTWGIALGLFVANRKFAN